MTRDLVDLLEHRFDFEHHSNSALNLYLYHDLSTVENLVLEVELMRKNQTQIQSAEPYHHLLY